MRLSWRIDQNAHATLEEEIFGKRILVTDHKIRVHLFSCVLAVSLAHLMRRECARAGLSLSVPTPLAELDGVGETVLLYQGERGRPRARHTITKMTPTQQHLDKTVDLVTYAPHH